MTDFSRHINFLRIRIIYSPTFPCLTHEEFVEAFNGGYDDALGRTPDRYKMTNMLNTYGDVLKKLNYWHMRYSDSDDMASLLPQLRRTIFVTKYRMGLLEKALTTI